MCALRKRDWKDIRQNISNGYLLWMVGLCIFCVTSTFILKILFGLLLFIYYFLFYYLLFIIIILLLLLFIIVKRKVYIFLFLAVTTHFHLVKKSVPIHKFSNYLI